MGDILTVGDEFEGKPIVSVGIEIPGVAGGLKDAMRFGPTAFGQGDEFTLVLHGTCQKVRFDPVNKDEYAGDQERVQILHVEEGTFISLEAVEDALKRQRELIDEGKKAEEAARGIHRLDLDGSAGGGSGDEEEEAFVLARNHAAGNHAETSMPGCPVCASEGRLNDPDGGDSEPDGESPAIPITKGRRQ